MSYTDYLEAYSDDYYATVYDYPIEVQIMFIMLEWPMQLHLYLREHYFDELHYMKENQLIGDFYQKGNAFLTQKNELFFKELMTDILPLKETNHKEYIKSLIENSKKSHQMTKKLIRQWVEENVSQKEKKNIDKI